MTVAAISHQQPTRSTGFSLVELMVAMTISLLLLAGVIQIYIDSKRNYAIQESLSRLQESGRYAVGFMNQDIRLTGYFGGNSDPAEISGSQPPIAPQRYCTTDTRWARMLGQPVFGLNNTLNDGVSDYSACINSNPANPNNGDYIQGDIIVLRHVIPAAVITYEPNRLYLRTSFQEGKLFPGRDESSNTLSDAPAFTYSLAAHAYYIGYQETRCNNNNILLPTLYRKALGNNGQPVQEELVRGIEDLELRYGIDSNNDGSVNRYLNADQVTLNAYWPRVASARFWILVRADCPVAGYNNQTTYRMGDITFTPNDGFRRQLYTSTIAIRN